MAENETDGMGVMGPTPEPITFNGRQLTITPLRWKQLKPFSIVLRRLLKMQDDGGATLLERVIASDPLALLDLFTDGSEDVAELIAIGTGIAQAELDEADAADVALAIADVVRVNKDFFIQKLGPAIKAAVAGTRGIGPIPSKA